MPTSLSQNRPFNYSIRGPWREYLIAALVYSSLAVWLHSINRPILFWVSVIFALGSLAGVGYLWRTSREIRGI
jgi:hypothetical protein